MHEDTVHHVEHMALHAQAFLFLYFLGCVCWGGVEDCREVSQEQSGCTCKWPQHNVTAERRV